MRKFLVLALVMMFSLAGGLVAGQVSRAADEVHWAYSGDHGPDHWGDLSAEFAACAQGKQQSPVDIPVNAAVNAAGITFNYQSSPLTISNNGHTIKVDYAKGSAIAVEGETYPLVQFHFHAPSEHTFSSQHAPMELHLVHQNAAGDLAVVGVMLNEGTANAAYDSVLMHMPATEGSPALVPGVTVNAADLLPADRAYYRYAGSLTTPPCSEGVKWLVLRDPVTLSKAQIAAFTALYPADARPLQPLNARTFLVGDTSVPSGMPRTGNNALAWLLVTLVYLALACLALGLVVARRKA